MKLPGPNAATFQLWDLGQAPLGLSFPFCNNRRISKISPTSPNSRSLLCGKKTNRKELEQALWNGLELGCKLHSSERLATNVGYFDNYLMARGILSGPRAREEDSCWEEVGVVTVPTSLFGVNFGSICPASMFAFPSVDVLFGSSPACQRKHLEEARPPVLSQSLGSPNPTVLPRGEGEAEIENRRAWSALAAAVPRDEGG